MWGFLRKELLISILTTKNQYWKSMPKTYYWKPLSRSVIEILLPKGVIENVTKNATKNL
jgi:hypothetical protein